MRRTSAKSWRDSLWPKNQPRRKQWAASNFWRSLAVCVWKNSTDQVFCLSADLPSPFSAQWLSSRSSFPSISRCFESFRGQSRTGRGSEGLQGPHGQRRASTRRTAPAGLWPEEDAAGRRRPARLEKNHVSAPYRLKWSLQTPSWWFICSQFVLMVALTILTLTLAARRSCCF